MKCDDARGRLIDSLYGETSGEEEASLREHLAGCDACRQEMAGLDESRRRLSLLGEPDVQVDFGRLYRTAANRAQKSRRRWRRLAVAASAAAVLATALAAARLQIEWRPGQLTVSWDGRPPALEPVRPRTPDPSPPPFSPSEDLLFARHEERIETLEEIARLLAAELKANEATQAAASADLQQRLTRWQRGVEQLARQSNSRWQLAEQNIRDLYLTQFHPDSDEKGAIP